MFLNEKKGDYFNEIAEHFFNRNFGTFSKADMDLLMFKIFIEEYESKKDGFITDYEISKILGITQTKVKNLRIKKDLVYGSQNFSWEEEFIQYTEYAKFDKTTQRVTVSILDPVVHLELQNYLEKLGYYNETQLNSKLLQIKIAYYIDLLLSFENNDNQKKATNQIIGIANKQIVEEEKKIKSINKDPLSKVMKDNAVDVITLVTGLLELSTGSASVTPVVKNGLKFLKNYF